jgi:hypothetical protein
MSVRGTVARHGLHAGETVRLLASNVRNGLSEAEAGRFGCADHEVPQISTPRGVWIWPIMSPGKGARLTFDSASLRSVCGT